MSCHPAANSQWKRFEKHECKFKTNETDMHDVPMFKQSEYKHEETINSHDHAESGSTACRMYRRITQTSHHLKP